MNNKSSLIEQIKRYAQAIPTRSRGPRSGTVAPASMPAPASRSEQVSGIPSRHKSVSNAPTVTNQMASIPSVYKMQDALISLANNVIEQVGTSKVAPHPGQVGVSQEQSEAASRTSFADFITKHYARRSDVPAVEFDPDPKKTKISEKDPSQATRINVVMDTMRRVGSGSEEFAVDGKWGPRTNAALRNAYALAFSLLNMSKDFGFTPRQYNEGNLAQLKLMIPEDETSISDADKSIAAKEITAHINGINRMFQEVKSHLLQNATFQSYIEGDRAFATYKKETKPQLTLQSLQAIKQSFPQGFMVPIDQKGTRNVQFTIDDLSTLDSFNKAVANAEKVNQVKLDPYNVLTQISNQVGKA